MNGRATRNPNLMGMPNAIFINQINCGAQHPIGDDPRWQHFRETGLSRSRNRALWDTVSGPIVVFGDDDVVYESDSDNTILDAFAEFRDADVIAFKARSLDGTIPFKNYANVPSWLNERTVARISSIEIAARVDQIRSRGIRFDERFGLGTNLPAGEEYIFLVDCLRAGLRVLFVPKFIVRHPLESTGRKWNIDLMRAKGAMLRRVFPNTWPLYAIAFVVKKAVKHKVIRSRHLSLAIFSGGLAFGAQNERAP